MQTTNSAGSRLGTKQRFALDTAKRTHGHARSTQWSVYSPRTERDWYLKGLLEWADFLCVEATPGIIAVDYAPPFRFIDIDGRDRKIELTSIVTLANGTIEWRHVIATEKPLRNNSLSLDAYVARMNDAAKQNGAIYRLIDQNQVYAQNQLIANWTRIIAWLSSVRGRPLFEMLLRIELLVKSKNTVSLDDILSMDDDRDIRILLVAATFKLLQNGRLTSDLTNSVLSKQTRFARTEI